MAPPCPKCASNIPQPGITEAQARHEINEKMPGAGAGEPAASEIGVTKSSERTYAAAPSADLSRASPASITAISSSISWIGTLKS